MAGGHGERLGSADGSRFDSDVERKTRSPTDRKRRILWIWFGVIFTACAATAIIVAVLISQGIIQLNSQSGGSTSGAAASGGAATPSASASRSPSSPTGTSDDSSSSSTPSATSSPTPVACSTEKDLPKDVKGTAEDITTWLDMTDFNCTYTSEMIGDLPLVGLNSTWDDSAKANPTVPALNEPWGPYTKRPARGVNLGGWLSLEPFITASLFEGDGTPDEWSLCKKLGKEKAAEVLEKHYATFITEADFKAIADAGLDHLRIPFSYWAVEVFDDDAYLFRVSWRYLLRGIEWARKYGLRIKLDLHGMPGSQNGWNHSGRSSAINWMVGPNGKQNLQRTTEIHNRLSKFFAQDRYKNIIAFYGIGNEPAITLPMDELASWTAEVFKVVQGNGLLAPQVFSDSMRGLPTWNGKLPGYDQSLVLDTHQYAIFDNGLLGLKHTEKVALACNAWSGLISSSMNPATGHGPTMVGEWSQADTDCTLHLNGVGSGARWSGTFFTAPAPVCAASECSCEMANADPSTYTPEYRTFLKTWAIAQMDAFEKSWGWFYWTWKSETAHQWSYQAGLKGGFMPAQAHKRDWDCSKPVPSFGSLPESY